MVKKMIKISCTILSILIILAGIYGSLYSISQTREEGFAQSGAQSTASRSAESHPAREPVNLKFLLYWFISAGGVVLLLLTNRKEFSELLVEYVDDKQEDWMNYKQNRK